MRKIKEIEIRAEKYALEHVRQKYSDIHSMTAKYAFVAVKNDFLAGYKEWEKIAKAQPLRERLDGVLMEYIREFQNKHEAYLEFAVGDDLMGILSFGDWFFNISDIIYDIDNDLPKGLIFRWHDDYLDEDKNPNSERINLHSYAKGLRFEDLYKDKGNPNS